MFGLFRKFYYVHKIVKEAYPKTIWLDTKVFGSLKVAKLYRKQMKKLALAHLKKKQEEFDVLIQESLILEKQSLGQKTIKIDNIKAGQFKSGQILDKQFQVIEESNVSTKEEKELANSNFQPAFQN